MFKQAYAQLLQQLEEMPLFLQKSMMAMPREVLLHQAEFDKSPLIEHLCHIRDCENDCYGLWIRHALAKNESVLPPIEVGSWPLTRDYPAQDGDQAIAEFTAHRNQLISELQVLDEATLALGLPNSKGGKTNILRLIQLLAEHDQDHRWRIAAILQSLSQPKETI
jgi:uncharacterized damage-inducible protein DinB